MTGTDRSDPSVRRATLAGALIIVLAGVFFCSRIVPYMVDDAYIYFRYAANLARGDGFAFNHGERPVEGFTSPLWVMLLAVGARLLGPAGVPSVATMLGLAAWLGCLAVIVMSGSDPAGTSRIRTVGSRLLPTAIWCLSAGGVFYAVSGLDTLLFILIVLVVHGAVAGSLPRAWGVVASGLAIWTRPEGPWLVVAVVAQLVVLWDWPRARRIGGPLLAALVVGSLSLLAFRWSVFHQLLPNTYYAKRPLISHGLAYVKELIKPGFPAAIAGAGLIGAILGGRRERAYSAAAVAWVAAAVLEGGDWMPHARMLLPALALAAVASSGAARLFESANRVVALTTGLAALALIAVSVSTSWSCAAEGQWALTTIVAEQRSLDRWAKAAGARSIALMDIGETGFALPDTSIVDLDGLTDARIGHAPGGHLWKEFDLGYLFDERRPDLIFIRLRRIPDRDASGHLKTDYFDTGSFTEGRIVQDPRLTANYDLIFVETPPALREPLYARAVYLRSGFILPPGVKPIMDVGHMSDPSDG